MKKVHVPTNEKRQVRDITDLVQQEMSVQDGFCCVFVTHTTVALTTADLDPGTDLDMLDAFDAMVPKLHYRHPHNPAHVPDHILSSLIGTSITVPVQNGKLVLGTWQRIVLIEFDGPQERTIIVE